VQVRSLSECCRAEDFGLPKGTGLRQLVSEWPQLWTISKEELPSPPTPAPTGSAAAAAAAAAKPTRSQVVQARVVRLRYHRGGGGAARREEEQESGQQQPGGDAPPRVPLPPLPSPPAALGGSGRGGGEGATGQAAADAATGGGVGGPTHVDLRQDARTTCRCLCTGAIAAAGPPEASTGPPGAGVSGGRAGACTLPCTLPCALLCARPHTGRRHQIRRHLAKRGLPIVGDVEYGKGRVNRPLRALGLRRPFLHAWRLTFPHPLAATSAAAAPADHLRSSGQGLARRGLVQVVAPLPHELRAFLRAAQLSRFFEAFAPDQDSTEAGH
jgi:hypothetical protein